MIGLTQGALGLYINKMVKGISSAHTSDQSNICCKVFPIFYQGSAGGEGLVPS
jgi:hypothetical protein